MNSRERVFSLLNGQPIDRPPCMPITMQFAADLIGAPYLQYETDFRTLAEGQLRVAEQFDFDYVNTMSDPAREAADCGASVEFFENSPAALNHEHALLADKSTLLKLKTPDPTISPRMSNGLKTVAFLSEKMGANKSSKAGLKPYARRGRTCRPQPSARFLNIRILPDFLRGDHSNEIGGKISAGPNIELETPRPGGPIHANPCPKKLIKDSPRGKAPNWEFFSVL